MTNVFFSFPLHPSHVAKRGFSFFYGIYGSWVGCILAKRRKQTADCWGCPQLHLEWCQLLTGKRCTASTDPHTQTTPIQWNLIWKCLCRIWYDDTITLQIIQRLSKLKICLSTGLLCYHCGCIWPQSSQFSRDCLRLRSGDVFSSKESSAVHSVDKLALCYCYIHTLMYNHTYCMLYIHCRIAILIFHLPIILLKAEQLQRLATGLGAGIFATSLPQDLNLSNAVPQWTRKSLMVAAPKNDHWQACRCFNAPFDVATPS